MKKYIPEKIIETLSNYVNTISTLTSNSEFAFNQFEFDDNINQIDEDFYFDSKYNGRFIYDERIASAWNKIAPLKDLYYYKAFFERYGNVGAVSKFYFRGLSDISYLNAPGIYRGKAANMRPENYFFNEIQVRCPSSFLGMKNINKLTYMQHYGCPTRLLDITSNPLVALYFACLGNQHNDGVVYVFGVPEKDVHYEQSDRVQMLSKLAEFKSDEQEQILIRAYVFLRKGKFLQISNGKYIDPYIERFYQSIKRDNGAFEREIVPLDLLKPLFVQVNKDNPRILKQDGAFIMSGLDVNEVDSNDKIDFYVTSKVVVPANKKQCLLSQLESVCINQASLFPEVDQVAGYLKQKKGI